MNKYLFFTILCCCITLTTSAQTLGQYKKAAKKAFAEKDYYNSMKYLYHVQEFQELSQEDNHYLAESAFEFKAFSIARDAYKTIVDGGEAGKFPLTHYKLALAQKNLGNYDEAKANFEKFLSQTVKQAYPLETDLAAKEIEYCAWASDVVSSSSHRHVVNPLSDSVNTEQAELSPFFMNDKLYYSSLRRDTLSKSKKYYSKLMVMGSDSVTTSIDALNKTATSAAHIAFDEEESMIYYTLCDYKNASELICTINRAKMDQSGAFMNMEKLPGMINTPGFTATHPNIGVNQKGEKVLYFVSDRVGGKGGKDIYASTINENGFGSPMNLDEINTQFDDITPFYSFSEETLYFSSMGRKGLGGFDVFGFDFENKSISHLESAINSSYDDLNYSVSKDGKKVFLSTNRIGSKFIDLTNEACCNDIWEVEVNDVDLQIITFDNSDKSDLNGTNVQLLNESGIIAEKEDAATNIYDFVVTLNTAYTSVVKKKGFKPANVDISTVGVDRSKGIVEKVYLDPITYTVKGDLLDALSNDLISNGTVALADCNGKVIETKKGLSNFMFNLDKNATCYKLIGSHPEYITDTVTINLPAELGYEDIVIEQNIKLEPIPITPLKLNAYLPLPIYFDNDMPDRRSNKLTTKTSYPNLARDYIAKESEYISGYAGGNKGREEIASFFNEVRLGASTFDKFSDDLLRYLNQGNTAELVVKAYASPRASDKYNFALTQRRVSSIRNHFQNFNGGELYKFILNGQLKITDRPYGESKAPSGVTSDRKDKRKSIYSPKASKERRVEILELKSELDENF